MRRRDPRDDSPARRADRAQTAVVGVAILLGLTVLAVGGLTATAGSIVADGAASASATRVAEDFRTALEPGGDERYGTLAIRREWADQYNAGEISRSEYLQQFENSFQPR